MDELDLAILEFLQSDGRKPFTEIANQLNVSEGTVRNRVTRLMDENALQIVGVVDPAKMGYQVSALIGVSISGGNIEQVARKAAVFGEVSDVVMVSGEFDLMISVYCKDGEHLSDFLSQKLRSVEGVTHTQTFVILRNFKNTNHLSPINLE
ncbi:MAG: Lrp/AsnC family transcriptional regulator [Anaerolineae bacterium]|nr:Lrp/AsnC family transcriptional regulator [Anaerolineae bacterium]MBL6965423.1 Lrp/AsnC family transcriptional regulator [Anaerolineales bacterium]